MPFKKIIPAALIALLAVGYTAAQIGGGGIGIGQGPTFTNITGSTQCLHANSVGTISGTGADCGSGAAAVGANPSGTIGLATINGAAATFLRSDGAPALSQSITPTWTGLHKFTNSDLSLLGSSTGKTIFTSANAGASDFTLTFPALTATLITSGDSATVTNAMLAGSIALTNVATQATNTVVGNATSGSASPTALAVGTCSTSGSAVKWTTNTGFGCNTAIDAATLGSATFAAPGPVGSGTPSTGAFTTLSSTSAPTVNGVTSPVTLFNWGIPVGIPPSGSVTDSAGTYVIGQVPSSSATCILDAVANGAGAHVTCSAATLLGTAADVGRIFTVLDSASYRYFTITTQISSTVATGTISNGSFTSTAATISGVAISGTAGQFTCTCTGFVVGMGLTLSGTYGGTGSITGYSNPTTYYVSATNGTSTFTLQSSPGSAIVTTAGTPTGITYTPKGTASLANANIWLSGTPTTNTTAFSVPLNTTYAKAYMYFPAGALCATCNGGGASAVGVHYVTCVSTTVCTTYADVYSSGTPAAPTSPVAISGAPTVPAFAQTTALAQVTSMTIPGNSLGPNGSLVYEVMAVRNSNTDTVAIEPFWNGVQVAQLSVVSIVWYGLKRTIRNLGVTNAQSMYCATCSAGPTDDTTANNATTYTAQDTTTNLNLNFKLILSTAATDWLFLQGGTITANYSP